MAETNIPPEVVAALMQRVRSGVGLKEAITEARLPLKASLLWLQKHARSAYAAAKSEARDG